MIKLLCLAAFVACAYGQQNLRFGLDGRIIGGEPVNIQQYPYQVSLQYYNSHICGGALISRRYILTAAHCTIGATPERYTILTGISNLREAGIRYSIRKWFQHPEFNMKSFEKDLTIIQLNDEINGDTLRQPVALPYDDLEPIAATPVVVTGWGALREGGGASDQLQKVDVEVIGREECQEAYQFFHGVSDYMICAGTAKGGKDACQGDSGGPMVANGKLIGIVSWGKGCGRPDSPGVYTHVAKLRPYIREYVGF